MAGGQLIVCERSDWHNFVHGNTVHIYQLYILEQCIDKKKLNFPQYREIHKGAVAKSYMTNGLLINE
jgi:hypothetical protein